MFSLMKSEWYRFIHIRSAVVSLVICSLVIAVIPLKDAFSAGYDSILDVSVTGYIALFCTLTATASTLLLLFLVFFTGYYEDKGYRNGINHHSVLCGYKRWEILLARFLAEGLIISFCILISIGIVMCILWCRNGMTDSVFVERYFFTASEMLPFKCFLLFLNFLHIIAVVILCSRLFKSGKKGALFSFVWFLWKALAGLLIRLELFGQYWGGILGYGEPFMAIEKVLIGFEKQDAIYILFSTVISMVGEILMFYVIVFLLEKITGSRMYGLKKIEKYNNKTK